MAEWAHGAAPYTNEHIDTVNYTPQDVHFKLLRPWADEDSTEKVQPLDMPKMISMWGSDDTSACLSPFRFVEASGNLLAALELLCDPSPSVLVTMGSVTPPLTAVTSVPSYASEYRKHRDFFAQLDNFEVTYSDWYPFELKARRDILKGVLFDWDAYASEVLLRVRLGELERERRPKRASDSDPSYPNKLSRHSRPDSSPVARREFRNASSVPEGTPFGTIPPQPPVLRTVNPSSRGFEITLSGPPRPTKVEHKRGSAVCTTSTDSAITATDQTPSMSALSAAPSMPLLSAARLVTGPLTGLSKPEEVLHYRDFSDSIHYRPRSLPSSPTDDELFERIVTPYKVSAYDRLLTKHNLHSNYPLLIDNLTRGFPLGTLPKLNKSIVIKNHPSVDLHPEAVADYLATEIGLGRMSGPFTLQDVERILRGPIYCSPFIVAKQDTGPDSPPKLRVCRNLSKDDPLTGTPSVNSYIAKEDFPTRFNMAFRVADEVARAPSGTQAMSFDIKAFHRTCPALPDHKPFLVVSFKGDFYIDHVHPFGARPASSNSGQVANASVDIWHAETCPSCFFFKYEDDIEAFHYPVTDGPFQEGSYRYAHDRDSVMGLVEDLNIPWHPEKTDPHFSTSFTYIGFSWDLVLRRVSLPEKKRLKYLNCVALMLDAHLKNCAAFNLRDIQIIHGTLVHVTFVYPEGSSRLPAFSNFMSGYKANTFVTHHLSDSVIAALRWWLVKLQNPTGYRQLHPIRNLAHIGIYVDASTSWGLGIIIGNFWYALKLVDDWKLPQHDICWLEAVAIELVFSFLVQLHYTHTHVIIHSDNFGAIGAHHKRRSPNIIRQTRSRVENRCGLSICRTNCFVSSMSDPHQPAASLGAADHGLRATNALSPRIPSAENFPRSARTTSSTVAPGVFWHPGEPPRTRRLRASLSTRPRLVVSQHPLVPAGQRLLLWITPHSQLARASFDAQIPVDAQSKIFLGLFNSLAESTRVSYGAGLLRFTQYCDRLRIPENLRMPASDILISAFVADTLGSCTGECIRNWLNGLRFWHVFNYAEWHGHEPLVHSLLKSADKQGIPFKRPPRQPITSRHLLALHDHLDLNSPSGAAIWACALVAFWGCRRLGELLPSKLSFDPSHHVSRDCDPKISSVNGSKVISFHVPWTKTSPQGIDCILTATHNIFCPVTALENHLRISNLPLSTPLFAYASSTSFSLLLKSQFLRSLSTIFAAHDLPPIFGHSFRIGGTAEPLAAGVPPQVVMKLGGWSSLCFLIYWRHLDFIVPAAITRSWAARRAEFANTFNLPRLF
ncbi:hypothetical protein D9615_008662 [Tricholomella constricta]|uniref:Uncharacterized protein n=1 Tax=Tricholomella constricta TaxID=117010 RepID=A0A8H5H4C5_9AGAR|nr:hypothetical protein D9615_008662 [Tricholomella constricta]